MNKFFKSILALVAGAAFVASCNPVQPAPLGTSVKADVTELEFDAQNSAAVDVQITSDGDWIAIADKWITLSAANGTGNSSLTVSVEDNVDADGNVQGPRSGKITLTCSASSEDGSFVITVNQDGDSSLDTRRTYVRVTEGVNAGKAYLIAAWDGASLQAAKPVEASKTYGYLYPLAVEDVDGTVSTADASCGFIFEAVEGGYAIRQSDGRYLIMTGTFNSFNVADTYTDGGVWTVEPAADGTFTIKNVAMQKWMQYSTQYGSYGSYNSESGVMPRLYEDTKEAVIDDSKLYAEKASLEVAADATSAEFSIVSNLDWTVSKTEGDWATLKTESGSNNDTVVVEFEVNAGEDRVAKFVVSSTDGSKSAELTLTQKSATVNYNTFAELIDILSSGAEHASSYTSKDVLVIAVGSSQIVVKDDTAIMFMYKKDSGLEVGDVVTLSGVITLYNGCPEWNSPAIEKTGTAEVSYPSEPNLLDEAALAAYAESPSILYGKVEGTKEGFNINVGAQVVNAYSNFTIADGPVVLYGYTIGYNSKGAKTNFVVTSYEEVEAPYSLDGKQWKFKWEDMNADAIFDFGVTEPGTFYFAYNVSAVNPEIDGFYFMVAGEYTIDEENSKVVCTLLDVFNEDVFEAEIPYSDLTADSVTFHFEEGTSIYYYFNQETINAVAVEDYIPVLDYNSIHGDVNLLPSGQYWIVANGKAALPLSKDYGYLSAVDLVEGASFARNRFTITQFSEEDPTYTIQDAEGYYYYNQEGYKTLSRSLTFDEYGENAANFVWTILEAKEGGYQISNNGTGAILAYSIQYNSFGVYNDLADTVLPNLILSTYWELEPAAINVPASKTVNEGETVVLSPSTNSDATAFTYVSADETIASVSAEGVVTGVKEGTTTITVSIPATEYYTEASAEVTVTVKAVGGEVTTVDDVLNQAWTGVTGTTYTLVEGLNGDSGAVYSVQCAGGNSSIQLRSKNSNSGIVTTVSGGKAVKVVVEWESSTVGGRTLDVYGSNTAYTNPTELYSDDTKGTKLGSIVCGTSTELELAGEYDYIAFRSNDSAMYITSITVTYQK
ncbi:MAG: BACON domain-containing protein [Candidatus Cryptobacteroides sp.]